MWIWILPWICVNLSCMLHYSLWKKTSIQRITARSFSPTTQAALSFWSHLLSLQRKLQSGQMAKNTLRTLSKFQVHHTLFIPIRRRLSTQLDASRSLRLAFQRRSRVLDPRPKISVPIACFCVILESWILHPESFNLWISKHTNQIPRRHSWPVSMKSLQRKKQKCVAW